MAEKHEVTVYSTPTCSWCHKAKEWLAQKGIPFKDVNVGKDPKAAAEMIEKSGQRGVPVIQVDKKIIVGFNEPALKKALGL
ncbi:MAG TPA: glutaredoxin family protein [Candidatus Nanoarchaeia archaeon]|nr:glutaredoxin family protein [Candidatus Nanoarchaeia archaeon]